MGSMQLNNNIYLNKVPMIVPDQVLKQYIDKIFANYDRDRSNTLEVNELASFFNDVFMMMGDPRRVNQSQAYQALMMIDQNNDGRASKMELFHAFKRVLNQQQGTYGQYGYSQGYNQNNFGPPNYNQGGYNQPGYSQNYNQGGFGQSNYGYPQKGFDSGTYGQGGYNQYGPPQAGYNQPGYTQGGMGYNGGGYGQGAYTGQGWGNVPSNQGWGQNYNSWGPTRNGGWDGGSCNKW